MSKIESGNSQRIQFAVIKLSRGDIENLKQQIKTAISDWRDSLVAAGFENDLEEHLR